MVSFLFIWALPIICSLPLIQYIETVVLAGDEAMKVYKGLSGYTEYIEKREQTGVAKGTGIRSGPVR